MNMSRLIFCLLGILLFSLAIQIFPGQESLMPTTFNPSLSSKIYKKNIQDLDVDADKIFQLRPVRFEWKENGQADIGLIAEDVNEIAPDLVIYNKEGNPNGVKYDKVAIYLLGALKQLKGEVETLKVENEQLKQRIEELEAQ